MVALLEFINKHENSILGRNKIITEKLLNDKILNEEPKEFKTFSNDNSPSKKIYRFPQTLIGTIQNIPNLKRNKADLEIFNIERFLKIPNKFTPKRNTNIPKFSPAFISKPFAQPLGLQYQQYHLKFLVL